MHKFKIEMDGNGRGQVYMDGERVQGVRSVAFRAGVDQINEITLTLIAGEVVVDGEAEVIEEDPRDYAVGMTC